MAAKKRGRVRWVVTQADMWIGDRFAGYIVTDGAGGWPYIVAFAFGGGGGIAPTKREAMACLRRAVRR